MPRRVLASTARSCTGLCSVPTDGKPRYINFIRVVLEEAWSPRKARRNSECLRKRQDSESVCCGKPMCSTVGFNDHSDGLLSEMPFASELLLRMSEARVLAYCVHFEHGGRCGALRHICGSPSRLSSARLRCLQTWAGIATEGRTSAGRSGTVCRLSSL